MTYPLVYVRTHTVVSVSPVCTVYWGPEDWAKVTRRVVEPLVLDMLGRVWVATGERNAKGELLYRKAD